MLLNWNLHPIEILRKCRCFYLDSLQDFEIRHPETRRRIAIELKLKLNAKDKLIFHELLKRFESAKAVISFFDWPVLMEWNEWRLQAETLSDLHNNLQMLPHTKTEVLSKLKEQMNQIAEDIRSDTLEADPGFFRFLAYRWKFSARRQEARYYIQRAKELSPKQTSGAVNS